MDDGGAGPSQQSRHDQADALAGAGGRETQDVFRAVMPEIRAPELAEDHAVGAKQASLLHLTRDRPARRAIGHRFFRFLRAPHRQADRDRD